MEHRYKLALIMYSDELGANVYYLLDENNKMHIRSSDKSLWDIRKQVINYEIGGKVIDCYPRVKHYRELKFNSGLTFHTEDYFDIRDIIIPMYDIRVGVLLYQGHSKKYIIDYEFKYYINGDNSYTNRGYRNAKWLINEAYKYKNNT